VITVAVGFIVFLALILASLADGLFLSNTGALRSSGADGYAYAAGSELSLSRSELLAEVVDEVAAVDGVAAAGPVAFLDLPATVAGEDTSVVVAGFEQDRPGGPGEVTAGRIPDDGEPGAVADSRLADDLDLGIDDVVDLGGVEITVTGLADDVSYLGSPTLWVPFDVWISIRNQARPELSTREAVQAVAFSVDGDDPAEVVAAVNAQVDAVEAVPLEDAVLALPAVAQQESVFAAIVGATFVVVALVVALFFALVTMEKRTQYAVLKAIGARTGMLAVAVLIQATVTASLGFLLGLGLTRLVGLALPPSVPATFVTATAVSLLVATVVMGGIGAVLSFRRIARIDPASALGGAE
jgi:putative ABC transport system permease protein